MHILKRLSTAFLLWFLSMTAAYAITFTNVIAFGDSLNDAGDAFGETSDVGNNHWISVKGKIGAPITNLDTLSQSHPLWINYFIDQYFHDKHFFPVRLEKSLTFNPLINHVNYAWASAETNGNYLNDHLEPGQLYPKYNNKHCKDYGPGLIAIDDACVPGLLLQVDDYLLTVQGHPNPYTMFIIWAGGNDIFNNISKLIQHANGLLDPKKLIDRILATLTPGLGSDENNDELALSHPINNLVMAKDKLIAAGVSPQQIYIIDMPDLSKTPAARVLTKNNIALLKAFALITKLYNQNLRLGLVHNLFNHHNLPADHIFSVGELIDKVQQHPDAYGITNISDSCADDGVALPGCEGYLFFNDKHPSTHWGKIMAKEFMALVSSN